MAHSGAGVAESVAAPVFTESRVEALRNHLKVLVKALKIGYAEAAAPDSTQKQREDANLLVAKFTNALEDVEEEYRISTVETDNVGFAANALLSELQVYRTVLGERFLPRNTAAPSIGVDTALGAEGGSDEATAGDTAASGSLVAAPGTGATQSASAAEGDAATVLSAVGEGRRESFALPQRPPTTPRTPRTPSRARITAPIYPRRWTYQQHRRRRRTERVGNQDSPGQPTS